MNKRVLGMLLVIISTVGLAYGLYTWLIEYYKQDVAMQQEQQFVEAPKDDNSPPDVDFDKLSKNVVGWIYIKDTDVNYPVYQGKNNTFYLRHLDNGQYSIGGEVFLDYMNEAPGLKTDRNSILYGHHLTKKFFKSTMFKTIADMSDQKVFDKIDTIWYITRDNAYELSPLLLYDAPARNTYIRQFDFEDTAEFQDYLQDRLKGALAKRSTAETDIYNTDKVMTLVTCIYNHGRQNYRAALVCTIKSVRFR